MSHAPYAPEFPASDANGGLSLAIFATRPHIGALMRDIASTAGFHVTGLHPVESLLDGDAQPLAEVVLVDCPFADGPSLAALARLDIRAAQAGANLVVATSLAALDDIFGCIDQSGAQLLVDPVAGDYLLALGRIRALRPLGRVRELSSEDRVLLLRLSEQVNEIAARLDRIDAKTPGVEAPAFSFRGPGSPDEPLVRRGRPAFPDPRMVRQVLRHRRQRAQFFDADMFADPAWDMLLDLTAARGESKRVSVTSLCIAASVPATTALRWIGQLIESGLFRRVEDMSDRRRAFIELTDPAAEAMARYFATLGEMTALPV